VRIIFLVRWPITPREVQKFSFEYLRSQGYEILVFDLSKLLNRQALLSHISPDVVRGEYITIFESYSELKKKVREHSARTFFVDYLVGLSDLDMRVERVFRILRKYGAKYIIISAGALPILSWPSTIGNRIKMLIKKNSSPKKVFHYLIRKFILWCTRHRFLYPLPYKIFSTDSEILTRFITQRNISRSSVIPIHSLDYDAYLRYQNNGSLSVTKDRQKICVFLDEAAAQHRDSSLLKIKTIDEKKYLEEMSQMFDLVEIKTGLKVVIASHPYSNYENYSLAFGGREIIKGKTVELVAASSMVIMHATTSVSYAVLFDKPIMVVKTAEMIKKGFSDYVDMMAAALGLKAINISDPRWSEHISFRYDTWPRSRYEDYQFKYVKSPHLGEKGVWEVFADRVTS